MPESQVNSIQAPVESGDRLPREARRSNALAAFILAEAVLASPIALAAGAAIFQFISSGEVSPAADFWLRYSLLFGVPMSVVAALHSVISKD